MQLDEIQARLRPHALALIAGAIAVALMLVWAVHDGGYDQDTWYWGALVFLGLLTAVVATRGLAVVRLSRAARIAVLAFALYTLWSYLSITWARSPGDALNGSNRTLLYFLVFTTMLLLPWTSRAALGALLLFVIGVGVIGIVLLFRLAAADNVANLVIGGRLASPTGYFNSTAALFTVEALVAIALAARRELPGLLRGVLAGLACSGLQLAVIVQSRGWLFTLPLIAIVTIVILPDRLRVAAAAVAPVAGTLVIVHRLLDVYKSASGPALDHASSRAGHAALLICALVLFVVTLIGWAESLRRPRELSLALRRAIGSILVVIVVAAVAVGGVAATHGHPVRFISRQWNGFSHVQTSTTGSHFTDVGSGRYDFWRVALDAFAAHPLVGLGQDNFDDYYVPRRRTNEEPAWTHSLELRLLTHTGLIGFVLFAIFLVAAIVPAARARRRPGLGAAVAGAAVLPLVVWLIYGSIDWFWEMPALSGPALGFLGMAGALSRPGDPASEAATPADRDRRRGAHPLIAVGGVLALVAAVVVLGFPYLSVREVSTASDLRATDPAKALSDLRTAGRLNPLSAEPGRLGGTIALQTGQYAIALERFDQAASREPGGWYGWLGAGLAASALGNKSTARHDLEMARSIDTKSNVIDEALARVDTAHPLSPADALKMLVVVG